MLEISLTQEQYEKLLKRLDNFKPVLKDIGDLLVQNSKDAFIGQRMGSQLWPRPYNGGPFNLAGIVSDLASSASVHDYNLRSRPALLASRRLFRSISKDNVHIANDEVSLAPNVPYAAIQQFGGISRQAITLTHRRNLVDFLRSHPQYRRRLSFIFRADEMVTNVQARPFLGFTPRLESNMVKAVEEYVAFGKTK